MLRSFAQSAGVIVATAIFVVGVMTFGALQCDWFQWKGMRLNHEAIIGLFAVVIGMGLLWYLSTKSSTIPATVVSAVCAGALLLFLTPLVIYAADSVYGTPLWFSAGQLFLVGVGVYLAALQPLRLIRETRNLSHALRTLHQANPSTVLKTRCIDCSALNRESAKFCSECGAPL
jgi:hypothetical protein